MKSYEQASNLLEIGTAGSLWFGSGGGGLVLLTVLSLGAMLLFT